MLVRLAKLACISVTLLTLLSGPAQGGGYYPSQKDIDCLARMVYHESRGEGRKGMIAVAYVAINRAEINPSIYGQDICDVVRKPYQFEGMKREREPIKEVAAWEQAKEVSTLTLYGMIKDPTNGALYFHANYIKPKWAYIKQQTISLGSHVFYK